MKRRAAFRAAFFYPRARVTALLHLWREIL
jgi:hypothetical protein